MTNPTTPFNWQMPTSTDLVTDLPADFETFGQAVATSMADLLGGTTGQILSKASNTDMDFTWITNDVGDITAVTAGTGISGGGTSGAVTITNDMATTITTNGDLIYGTGSGTYTRRGIGSTGQVLTVSGGVPTWSTPSTPTITAQGVSVTNSTNQAISTATDTALTFNTETFDTDGFHSTTSNTSRLTVPAGLGGLYYVAASYYMTNANVVTVNTRLRKNGGGTNAIAFSADQTPSGYEGHNFKVSGLFQLVAGDYLEIYVYQASGNTRDAETSSGYGYFQMNRIGA